MLSFVIRHMEKHKCGLQSVCFKHQLKLVCFTDAAFKAQPYQPTGLARGGWRPRCKKIRQRMISPIALVVWLILLISQFGGKGVLCLVPSVPVDSIEQLLLLQVTLHHIYIYIYIYIAAHTPITGRNY